MVYSIDLHDLERHTCLYNVPQLTVHVRAKTMSSKEMSVELRDRIVSRHKSGDGYQKVSNNEDSQEQCPPLGMYRHVLVDTNIQYFW